MIEIPFLHPTTPFPDVSTALDDPDGLLAFGGGLDVNRLFTAYSHGIFPWFSEDEPILWWSPSSRAIIYLKDFHTSRSLRKLINKKRYRVTLDADFKTVIEHCANIPRSYPGSSELSGTWITENMMLAYQALHEAGLAHSVEVWEDNTIVGGLYGVAIGKIFCGESMFHTKTDTSKLALSALVKHMQKFDLAFIDCQLPTPHLASLGAKPIKRERFIRELRDNNLTCDSKGYLLDSFCAIWKKQDITP
ncbi:leucyl/phenylalanyl-tRNA--protein transferase [Alteromonas sp. ASW11-130]|uniref:leucyl/phenylalanyl-tRNA--protein transferase n=1 Tax=Alteromonas sp. ASW11-130 TaxID=3015775 RepID=UPI002241F7C0|nr:leucyl/phenylalanyl-tRNA--protein transferase [Alteromonas sp. ASW11-130]MCW8092057.1 leucyl/phenylalanyl-tRNA--protein transferase [Alteromonas sp. ASW11-130]